MLKVLLCELVIQGMHTGCKVGLTVHQRAGDCSHQTNPHQSLFDGEGQTVAAGVVSELSNHACCIKAL